LNSLSTQQMGKFGALRVARNVAIGGLLAGVVAGLSACGVLKPQTSQEALKERAQERWDALVKSDVATAYRYLSPSSKALMTEEAYRNSLKLGFWKSVVVDRIVCSTADSCDAIATVEYEFQGRRFKSSLKETWIREGSNWWLVQK
jgi:succinate dehydrogenase/fumarate reductase flavoprotein subunit